jgi:hypothetical protein
MVRLNQCTVVEHRRRLRCETPTLTLKRKDSRKSVCEREVLVAVASSGALIQFTMLMGIYETPERRKKGI